jgi:hypothetical protein
MSFPRVDTTIGPCLDCTAAIVMGRTASQSLQAMQRSSPEGYRLRACSPRNRGEIGPYIVSIESSSQTIGGSIHPQRVPHTFSKG